MDPQNPPNASGGPQRQQPVYDTNHGGHYGELKPPQKVLLARIGLNMLTLLLYRC